MMNLVKEDLMELSPMSHQIFFDRCGKINRLKKGEKTIYREVMIFDKFYFGNRKKENELRNSYSVAGVFPIVCPPSI